MTTQIFKTILAGILAGIVLFILPFFLIRVFVIFLLIGAIFKLIGSSRRSRYFRMNPAYADHFQSMSDDERKAYKMKFKGRCGFHSNEENSDSINSKTI